MHVGHINLEKSMNGMGEHFIRLVEALDRQGLQQHVIVANQSLAQRVAICENVAIGPIATTAVMAYCLMPDVDVVHAHDPKSNQAGLVLRLTRSIPFVLTRRSPEPPARNPMSRSLIERAATIICPTDDAATAVLSMHISVPVDIIHDISYETDDERDENRVAAEHHRIYRRALDSKRVPAMLL